MDREYVIYLKNFLRSKNIIWNEKIGDSHEKDFRQAEDSDFSFGSYQTISVESREEMELCLNTQIDLLHCEIIGADYDKFEDCFSNEIIASSYQADYTQEWIEYQINNCKRLFSALIEKHSKEQRDIADKNYEKNTKNNLSRINILNIRLNDEYSLLRELCKEKDKDDVCIAMVERNIKRLKKKISLIQRYIYIAETNYTNDLAEIEKIENLV